jgi:hypothetical protein
VAFGVPVGLLLDLGGKRCLGRPAHNLPAARTMLAKTVGTVPAFRETPMMALFGSLVLVMVVQLAVDAPPT